VTLSTLIKAQALGLGFDLAGIATLGPVESADKFDDWLAHGYAGDMTYLERGAEKRHDSRLPFRHATSAIVVGLNYGGTARSGPVARYARGDDYHDVMTRKLDALHQWIEAYLSRKVSGKPYVDTGPILERDLARKAGLGWIGKNTNLINPDLGSFLFIGALFVNLELEADAPFEADRCGTCTRCLEVCPTSALVEQRVLDATRCISYLTIESRGGIAPELREAVGSLLYGCDICQDVCPWNVRFSRDLSEPALAPRDSISNRSARVLAREILTMDDAQFREAFRNSPMKRARRTGLARSAAVVLGNIGNIDDREVLEGALDDSDGILREHAQWALDELSARLEGARGR
jgi:epoxyqueuosine reductase